MAKKGKKKKKAIEEGEKKKKKPSEKSVFKSRVRELEAELGSAHQEFEHSDSTLERLKQLLAEEKDSFESCVRHLRRVLSRTTSETDEVRQSLQLVVDMGELDERRTGELSRNLERNQEVARSLFQQEKSQLEDQMSRLESKRQERNSQLSRLKQQEETLQNKTTSERLRRRQEDSDSVTGLLQKRDAFVRLVNDLASESKAVFSLSLPVRARLQLEENVRLRSGCCRETMSSAVLALQDRIRDLKRQQKVVDVETETQRSTGVDVESRKASLERRLEALEEENSSLLERVKGLQPEDLQALRKELWTALNDITLVEDDLESVSEIREDQIRYQRTLEDRIKESRDRNGIRMSSILKAGEVFKVRMGEVRVDCPDVDLLKQITMILDED